MPVTSFPGPLFFPLFLAVEDERKRHSAVGTWLLRRYRRSCGSSTYCSVQLLLDLAAYSLAINEDLNPITGTDVCCNCLWATSSWCTVTGLFLQCKSLVGLGTEFTQWIELPGIFFFQNIRTNLVRVFTSVTVYLLPHKQKIHYATCKFETFEELVKLRNRSNVSLFQLASHKEHLRHWTQISMDS